MVNPPVRLEQVGQVHLLKNHAKKPLIGFQGSKPVVGGQQHADWRVTGESKGYNLPPGSYVCTAKVGNTVGNENQGKKKRPRLGP
jgi:hypothetical protein